MLIKECIFVQNLSLFVALNFICLTLSMWLMFQIHIVIGIVDFHNCRWLTWYMGSYGMCWLCSMHIGVKLIWRIDIFIRIRYLGCVLLSEVIRNISVSFARARFRCRSSILWRLWWSQRRRTCGLRCGRRWLLR